MLPDSLIFLQAENTAAPVFVLALACVFVLSIVGFAVLFGLSRRIQQLGDQPRSDPRGSDQPDD